MIYFDRESYISLQNFSIFSTYGSKIQNYSLNKMLDREQFCFKVQDTFISTTLAVIYWKYQSNSDIFHMTLHNLFNMELVSACELYSCEFIMGKPWII